MIVGLNQWLSIASNTFSAALVSIDDDLIFCSVDSIFAISASFF
jgi:hypothetical protein